MLLFLFIECILLLTPNAVHCESTEDLGLGDEEKVDEFDASGCGLTKGCLMKPPNCTPHKDCAYAMSYTADTERIYFELLGQVQAERNSYVALGFSVDGLMGGDTVTDCSSFEGAPFKARLSYNPGKSNRKVPLDVDQEAQILRTHTAVYADGTVYCRFSQLIQPPGWVQPQFVRHFGTPIFILMSSGITWNEDLTMHETDANSPFYPFASSGPIQLIEFTNLTTNAFVSTIASSSLIGNFHNGTTTQMPTTYTSDVLIK